jgi:UDP-2,3-diacylglucosamine pyrophosphatase LpxH
LSLSLARFDDLYVISDLHLGGPPDFQIFKQGRRLASLLRRLAGEQPDREVALVINGDVIDSLAEEIDGYIAVDRAEAMMERIYADPAFQPVWDALAEFVRTPRRYLVIGLGNHDIELALPHVELYVRRRLAGGDPAAQGRLLFATRGAGFACQVGPARVLCTHGNEVDGWNVVDHEALRRLAARLNAGLGFDRAGWTPNAGTRFVIDVMNPIKRRNPFIDLLKPEANSVFAVLLTIDPAAVKAARDGLPVVTDRIRGELIKRGLLAADARDLEAAPPEAAAAAAMEELLGANLREALGAPAPHADADALLLDIEEEVRRGRSASEAASREAVEGQLGWWDMIVDRLQGVPKEEALRRAILDWIKDDRSFDITTRDHTFRNIMERVGPGVDYVVTGHTHLERAIEVEPGGGRYYYNSGTWVRILQLTEELVADPKVFAPVWEALKAGSMAALDAAVVPAPGGGTRPLLLDRTTVVGISAESDGAVGRLYHAVDGASGETLLEPVPGSEFRRR